VSARVRRGEAADIQGRTRRVNQVVHWVLLVGLAVSAALMLGGLAALTGGHHLPTHVLKLGPAFRRAAGLHADGLLTVGLLALVLTPFLRVAGSAVVFVWERDWRYSVITLVVLAVMVTSLFVGRA
jgi:uncharacterized membrane protein